MAEENIDKRNISGGYLKKLFAYGLLFVLGILAGNLFGADNSGALKETASLVSQTGKEVFGTANSRGVNFSLPLRSAAKPKAAKTSVPATVPSAPKIAATQTVSSATSSASPTSSIILAEASPTSSVATSSAQTGAQKEIVPAARPEVAQTPAPQANPAVAKLLIFEVQITGGPGNSEQDFIKIYNPTPYAVDASGWKLRKRSKTGSEASIKVIPDGTNIPSGAVLTWANSKDNFSGTMSAELSSTATISADNSVAVLDGDGKIIDAVAWGGGTGQFVEGAPYPNNPEAGQILRRKVGGANLQDSDNNSLDFAV